MIRRLYPGGKRKAFNITYDDGILQDVRFVELLNKYDIKGTFNLNSELMRNEFEWVHECGMTVKRLPAHAVVDLYQNHEVASHTLTHPYMFGLSEEAIMYEMGKDKENLEALFGRKISGFAVPFDYYDELIERCVRNCGFEYGRCSEESRSYKPCEDYFRWKAGIFHLSPDFEGFVEGFFQTEEELAVCQIVGHAYDLDVEGMWDVMEAILQRIQKDETVWSATHIELVQYLKAMRQAALTETYIKNNSENVLWFEIAGEIKMLQPWEMYKIQ